MMCSYCKHEVENPYHNQREVQQRATDYVERCEQKDASQ